MGFEDPGRLRIQITGCWQSEEAKSESGRWLSPLYWCGNYCKVAVTIAHYAHRASVWESCRRVPALEAPPKAKRTP